MIFRLRWNKKVINHRQKLKEVLIELAFVALFVMYVSFYEVILMCFEVFATDEEGFFEKFPWLLWQDNSSNISGLKWVAGFFGCVYGAGIPAVIAVLLLHYRNENRSRMVHAEEARMPFYSFVFENYRPQYYFYELAWIFRRIVIAATVMIPKWGAYRLLGSMVILLVLLGFVCVEHFLSPFVHRAENTMNLIGSSVLVITLSFQTWVVFAIGNNVEFSLTGYAPIAFYFVTFLNLGYIVLLVTVTMWPLARQLFAKFQKCCFRAHQRRNLEELSPLVEDLEPEAIRSVESDLKVTSVHSQSTKKAGTDISAR
jgi:hypothetical protein